MEENYENLDNDLKVELDKIRTDYKRAKRLLKTVEVFGLEEYAKKFKEWEKQLDNEENGVEAILEWIKESKIKISESEKESELVVDNIRSNLSTVKENIISMQDAYEKFLQVQGKLEGTEANINNLSENAKQLKDDIDGLKNDSQNILDSIKELFEKANEQIVNMQSAYESFLVIKGKIEDENTGLEVIFEQVQGFHKKSQSLYKEIQSFRDEGNTLLDNIKNTKGETDNIKENIEKIFNESKIITDKKIKEIEIVTSLITDTGFANSFHKQAKKLNIGKGIWGVIIIFVTIGLSIMLYKLFVSFDTETEQRILLDLDTSGILYRLSLTSPLLFLIAFAVKQFGKDSNLNDKYEFKATTASSISHHIEFLKKEFPENDDIILTFAKDTFIKIYKEPYKTDYDKNKEIKELENKLLILEKNIDNKGGKKENIFDVDKLIKQTKDLKEIFTDESILKDIFIKLSGLGKQ